MAWVSTGGRSRARFLVHGSLLLLGLGFMAGSCSSEGEPGTGQGTGMEIDQEPYGLNLYTLTNRNGLEAKITSYGGIITSLRVPDREGTFENVVLGFESLEKYLEGHPYFGSLVGRVGNRIAAGRFTLDGREYRLATNNGPNHLHGGIRGFDTAIWQAEPFISERGPALRLTYLSPDQEEGYPGNLEVEVVYILSDDDALIIEYSATTDAATPVTLTPHSYFNLRVSVREISSDTNSRSTPTAICQLMAPSSRPAKWRLWPEQRWISPHPT